MIQGVIATVLILGSVPFSYGADQSDSAQQALQQLRLLQQKLSQTSSALSSVTQPNQAQQPAAAATAPAPTGAPAATPTQAPANRPAPPPPPPPQQQAQTETSPASMAADNELIDTQAFEGVTRQLFPLTPEQIVRLKQIYNASEYAQAATAGTPPKPTATSQFVNLSPGSTPPVIRLSQGFVSSLVFLDSTGAPWPISAYDLGDPASFNIQWDKTGNTLMIQSLKLYTYGNLAVRLRGLNTPVMLTLIPGQKAVDYRVDLRVQGIGPNAKAMPMEEGIPPSANDLLLHVLDGVPPPGSQRLTVSGGDARAWLLNEKMYIRTNLTILSPGWIASMTSADGMHAYEMQKSPVLLVSWHGKVMQLKVEGL
nr:DotH/IcmK family type IV secretion protein [Legionella clemsonensis]